MSSAQQIINNEGQLEEFQKISLPITSPNNNDSGTEELSQDIIQNDTQNWPDLINSNITVDTKAPEEHLVLSEVNLELKEAEETFTTSFESQKDYENHLNPFEICLEDLEDETVFILNCSEVLGDLPKTLEQDLKEYNTSDFEELNYNISMADLNDKLNEQQQEISDLKLQLNASQQINASLELEIRQKEEIIIKTQAEAMKMEQALKQEKKQFEEKINETIGNKELEEALKEAKVKEAQAISELNAKKKDEFNAQELLESYDKLIADRYADYKKLQEEHAIVNKHLANLEVAFSDVHQKYERAKHVIEGFKTNQEALLHNVKVTEEALQRYEDRYESLKSHAKAQIENANKDILSTREKYESEIGKLKAIIKRLEIKYSSMEVSLEQKTRECLALSALCDEVTGKKL